MKVFKLAKAELGKLLLRPAIYLMTAFLVLSLIITTFTFSPQTREQNLTTFGGATESVSVAFSTFNNSTNIYSKPKLDENLTSAYQSINDFATNTTSPLDDLIEKTTALNTLMTGSTGTTLPIALSNFATDKNNSSYRSALINILIGIDGVRNSALEINNYCNSSINSTNIDFYATTDEIKEFGNYFRGLGRIIPVSIDTSTSADELINIAETVRNNYNLSTQLNKLNSFIRISISTDKTNEIIEKYYTNIKIDEDNETLLSKLYNDIEIFVENNSSSTEKTDKLALNELITKYKNASIISTELLNCSFAFEKIGDYSNAEIVKFIGFENYNIYELNERYALNNYLFENAIYDGNYLLNYNYNSTSGYTASAYDFAFYSMQILGIIITIFCLFFAVSITSGEFQNGTMKMVATRPFSRSKLISGKRLSCINLMLIFILFSFIASMVVGIAMYGIGLQTVLVVFNSSQVVALPDFAVMLIYLASLAINIMFYIAIAFLLSIIFRSSTFSLFITFLIYFFGLLFNAIASTANWFLFTPYAHLDLFKFLGNSSASSGFLAMNMPIGTTFLISALVLPISIIVINTITKLIFKNKDIA